MTIEMNFRSGQSGYVDYRSSLSLIGTIIKYLSLTLVFPLSAAIYYNESVLPFVTTVVAMAALGIALERLEPEPDLGHREGFLLVSLTWLLIPAIGTIPYLVAGQGAIAHPVNALFESMSGFTTTGATVLIDISFEQHSRSILLWRQFTQWIGGMGIIILMIAILPQLSVGGAQLMQTESPGFEVQKLTPRIRETARALWIIYLGFTVAAVVVYYSLHLIGVAPNMDLYNAVAHALTTLPTGGFSPEARSIEAFSPAVQWVVIVFMIVAGTNFALYWHVQRGESHRMLRNAEFRAYLRAIAIVGVVVSLLLFIGVGLDEIPTGIDPISGNVEESFRQGIFQVTAIITTTGYASMDFNTWDTSTKMILLLAMFLGGSAGSAAGSIKIIRWYIILKSIRREFFTTVRPEAVVPIRMSNEIVDERAIRGVFIFTTLFIVIFSLSTVLIFLDGLRTGLELTAIEAMSVAIASLGNIGPGVGIVGPMNSYNQFSDVLKLYLVFLMWIGRLEIISVLVIFSPNYWKA